MFETMFDAKNLSLTVLVGAAFYVGSVDSRIIGGEEVEGVIPYHGTQKTIIDALSYV